MGGYGSGRHNGKPLADSALRIDFAWMLRRNYAVPRVLRIGTLRWTCQGEPAGNISYTCDMRDLENARLELRFAVTDRRSGEKRDYVQHVRLSHTVPHFGGERWWMHCPTNGSRAGKLYCPSGIHSPAGRHWALAIKASALLTATRRLRRCSGCKGGWGAGKAGKVLYAAPRECGVGHMPSWKGNTGGWTHYAPARWQVRWQD